MVPPPNFHTSKNSSTFNQHFYPLDHFHSQFLRLFSFFSSAIFLFWFLFLFSLLFSVAPSKIVVSEAVYVMDDGGSSDARRPRLPGVCIVDVDSNAEPYWLLLVFLPKRARVCSNQLTACPINTGALISLLLAFSPPPPPPSSTGSLAARSLANGARPAVGPRLVARPCRRHTPARRRLGLQCVYFVRSQCEKSAVGGVILCVLCHFASPLCSMRAKVDFATDVLGWLTQIFSVTQPDLLTDILLSRQTLQ